jgi:hypothetical protein
LQREPHTGKTWFHAGTILPNEEHVDTAFRELLEETCRTIALDDLTPLSNNHVRVPLLEDKHKLVYVFSASALVPSVVANIRTPTKLAQAVTTQSTINLDGTYVIHATIDIDGLSLTPTKTRQLLK